MNGKRLKVFGVAVISMGLCIQSGFFIFTIDRPVSAYFMIAVIAALICMGRGMKIGCPKQIKFFLAWLLYGIVTASLISPGILGYSPKLKRIAYETVYMLLALLYMVFGYNTARHKCDSLFWKVASYTALFVAFLAIPSELFHISKFKEWFYMSGAGIRFQGVAANSNDYMPLALAVLPYFLYSRDVKWQIRLAAVPILLFSYIAAGSKGGSITVLLYILMAWIEKVVLSRRSDVKAAALLFFLCFLGGLLLVYLKAEEISRLLWENFGEIAGIERILFMFSHPVQALSEGGSLRIETWTGALLQIKSSPLLGVGIGSSERVLETIGYPYSRLTPHSIYLELLAQSGILWFVFITVKFLKYLASTTVEIRPGERKGKIIRHSFYLLLLNGIYFASDWTMIFWLLMGLLLYYKNASESQRKRESYETL